MNIRLQDIKHDISRAVKIALEEDIGDGDITSELIDIDKIETAHIVAREACVLCGTEWVNETYQQLGGILGIDWHFCDGNYVHADSILASITGNARKLLTGERTALNFLQLLCGNATAAHHYANTLGRDTPIKLLDTRKTIPGLRTAQKYAIATGGCHNHRIGLFDAYLIKENHIAACGSIAQAINTARKHHPNKPVEIEVESVEQLRQALVAGADIIMLDNFNDSMLRDIQNIDKGEAKYELSGNLVVENIAAIKNYNIDYVSFGALTKNVRAVDLSFRIT